MALSMYLNGRFASTREEAKVSLFDHGMLYGDGIFEGIRAYYGRIFRLEDHLDRLYRSARGIDLEIPLDRSVLRAAILETVRRSDLDDAYIRVVVSRGPGDLGIDPRKCLRPAVYIIADRISEYPAEKYERGLRVEERPLVLQDLYGADEVFLSGTGAELVPVIEIDGRIVSTGQPGPIFKRLLSEFRERTKWDGVPIHDELERKAADLPSRKKARRNGRTVAELVP